jgi:uncharacterized protein YcbK (DUF882 family)
VQAKEVKPIDLGVYDILAMVQGEFRGRPIMVTNGYRTKATDDRLRRQGIDAARRSFHLLGRAADIQIDGVPAAHLATLGSDLRLGGVGIYATYIHLDTGTQRFWRASPTGRDREAVRRLNCQVGCWLVPALQSLVS